MKEKTKDFTLQKLAKDLVKEGLITQEQLEEARKREENADKSLGHVLVEMGFLSSERLVSFISSHLNIPSIDLSSYVVDPEVINLISEEMARRYKILPLFKVDNTLTVAMADPLDIFALDEVQLQTGFEVEPIVSGEDSITRAINENFSSSQSVQKSAENIKQVDLGIKPPSEDEIKEIDKLEKVTEQPPVVKFVNEIILQAIRDKASDIHIEPEKDSLSVYLRIDGVLQKVVSSPSYLQMPVISRIKIISDMDISEKRLPQDGRIQTKIGNREVDLRVSTFPTIYGEKVVMRVLDKSAQSFTLADIGFSPENLKKFRSFVEKPYGVILVTGPTGSGKSTTLYAALNVLKSPERKVITLEDPVEYQMDGVTQGQINAKIGLTFAVGLRTILRQDPDVIMVGEVRDLETAELAVRSALTGHLVLSTLHTNDAASTLTRLVDMGIEPFLIASSVVGVVSQRLVRKICLRCKETYIPDSFSGDAEHLKEENITFFRGKGCRECKNTGYKGRIGIFELLAVDENIRKLISERATASVIRKTAQENGMKTLREDGLEKVLKGITTMEEVLRTTTLND